MNESTPSRDRYALIGHPVAHSRSPLIHALFARQTGQAISYGLVDAAPPEFATAVRGFIDAGGCGMNVTVPHKEAAFELADEVGAEAAAAQAVNTLSFESGRIRGDNTDGVGFARDLTVNEAQAVEGRRVLVLGAGGAARGILGPLLAARPAGLVVANRTVARAERLAERFAERFAEAAITACGFDALASLDPFDIVVNATSAGLGDALPPFPGSLVTATTFCYDLVYGAERTPFAEWAERHGAGRAVDGLGMLVEQAAESFRIWRGVMPETAPVRAALRRGG